MWPKAKTIQTEQKPAFCNHLNPSARVIFFFFSLRVYGKKRIRVLTLQWGSCGYKRPSTATPTPHSRATSSIQWFVWTINTLVSKYKLVPSTKICRKMLNKDQPEAWDMSCWLKEEEIWVSSSTDGQIKIAGEMKRGREMHTSQKMRNLRIMREAYALFKAWYVRGVDQSLCPHCRGCSKKQWSLEFSRLRGQNDKTSGLHL